MAARSAAQPDELSIGELAARTGLGVQTLRAWETRHGFPVPLRTPSGHRRFRSGDVDQVTRVLALKESGLRLDQAIARVRLSASTEAPSVFGAIRRGHPEVPVQRLARGTLARLSRAIEDEAMARAGRPVIGGAFQTAEFFGTQQRRWAELARTAEVCVVLADFDGEPTRAGGALVVDLPEDSTLLREWAVVVWSEHLTVALSAWEVPSSGGVREFESLFTVNAETVRTAARALLGAAGIENLDALLDAHAPSTPTPMGVDALCLRAFGYLQGKERR